MRKTNAHILSFLLIPAILLPLLLSACAPDGPEQTTPSTADITTPAAISAPEETTKPPETTPATVPPEYTGTLPLEELRELYDSYWEKSLDEQKKGGDIYFN